jgi:aminobenzoyl-glutamate utilization protein A
MHERDLNESLRTLRRDLHQHPEPAWREFYTTARIVEELHDRPLTDLRVGDELFGSERAGVPDEGELERWRQRATDAGADPDVVERLGDGATGALAVIERGPGPTVALRVDIDALPIREAETDHRPAAEGFRSNNEGHMHACGHDAHATIGVGVLDAILDSDFPGTLKVLFQPAEETIAGAEPVAESGLLDDVDHLIAIHIGLDHPTGEVVAGIDGFLAVRQFTARFTGESTHAGRHPEDGYNAVQAMATAVSNLYAIPRHSGGATRVNAGRVGGGTASNVVPEAAFIEGELRGETTELLEYVHERAEQVLHGAATTHGCTVDVDWEEWAPSARSDDDLRAIVAAVAADVDGVDSILERDDLGASEDATFLMQRVQDHGGTAAYVVIGTDHPDGHHTPRFDVDEESIRIGIDVLAGAIERLGTA